MLIVTIKAQDNMWPIVTSLILPTIALEFHQSRPPLLSLAQNLGLLAGKVSFLIASYFEDLQD